MPEKLTLEDARKRTEARGFRLLSGSFEGVAKKHLFGCAQDHLWEARPNGIWKGSGCPHCFNERRSDAKRLTLEEAIAKTRERGLLLLSEAFEGVAKKHRFVCAQGHEWGAPPSRVWGGSGCPHCFNERRGDDKRLPIEEAIAKTRERGFRLLSPAYDGNGKKHRFACPQGHEWEAKPANVWQGYGCPGCASLKSESLVREILAEDFGIPTEKIRPAWLRHRKGKPLELDGFQEGLGFAWEHQGVQHFRLDPFFHRDGEKAFHAQRERDAFKREAAALQKILLFEIPQTKPATREKIKETIEREAERLCLPFAFNPAFREMLQQSAAFL